jgi:phage terminase large subunit-like protein
MKDYAAIATQYARDVVDGRILACKWVRLACRRHLNDLAREIAGWRYAWNPELESKEGKKYRPGDRACHFIELLPHIKGDWASRGERIRLEAWEVFIVASVFGWVDRETKRRRFREADLFVPRKNSKSTLAAAIGLYMVAADGEFGAEVYSGATSEDQAGEVFNPARLMAERTPDYRGRFGVLVRASAISVPETNSKFEPIIGKPGDGASPSCAIVDEYHEHQTEDLYDTMKTGMGARSQPLMLVITTAGDDISGPCYAHQEDLQQILEGVIENEQRFGVIFTIDVDADGKLEDWTTEEALIKANPNFGISIDAEFLLSQQRDAIRDPRKQATFQTKHLNIWVQSANPWLNMHEWKDLADKNLKLEQFAGETCHEGLDLANVTDIASRCKLFRRWIGDELHYYAFWKHYLPATVIADPENKHYQGWKREGWLSETPGSMIDQEQIKNDLVAERLAHTTIEVAIDAWGSPGISAALDKEGYTVVRIPQNVAHLSAPMKFVDGLVKSGRIHHNGDPVATWGVSNVQVKPDRNDNWFPRRGSKKKKIDPGLALILAIARAIAGAEPQQSAYEKRGIRTL